MKQFFIFLFFLVGCTQPILFVMNETANYTRGNVTGYSADKTIIDEMKPTEGPETLINITISEKNDKGDYCKQDILGVHEVDLEHDRNTTYWMKKILHKGISTCYFHLEGTRDVVSEGTGLTGEKRILEDKYVPNRKGGGDDGRGETDFCHDIQENMWIAGPVSSQSRTIKKECNGVYADINYDYRKKPYVYYSSPCKAPALRETTEETHASLPSANTESRETKKITVSRGGCQVERQWRERAENAGIVQEKVLDKCIRTYVQEGDKLIPTPCCKATLVLTVPGVPPQESTEEAC